MCKGVVEHTKYNVMFDEYYKVYTTTVLYSSVITFYNIGEKPRLHY